MESLEVGFKQQPRPQCFVRATINIPPTWCTCGVPLHCSTRPSICFKNFRMSLARGRFERMIICHFAWLRHLNVGWNRGACSLPEKVVQFTYIYSNHNIQSISLGDLGRLHFEILDVLALHVYDKAHQYLHATVECPGKWWWKGGLPELRKVCPTLWVRLSLKRKPNPNINYDLFASRINQRSQSIVTGVGARMKQAGPPSLRQSLP